jgi:hypothetical protein
MAPLIVQQAQLARVRRKRDLVEGLPSKKRASDGLRPTTTEGPDERDQATWNFSIENSLPVESDCTDSPYPNSQIWVIQNGSPIIRRDKDSSTSKHDEGILGQLLDHPLFPFLHKSTASPEGQSTTTALTATTTTPVEATSTTAAILTTSAATTSLATPPPTTAVASTSTAVDTPPPPPPPPPPSTTSPIAIPVVSSTVGVSTTSSDLPVSFHPS